MEELKIITRNEARRIQQKWYYTGISCKNGHIDKRYVNTGICYGCKRSLNKICNVRHPDTLKKISKRGYKNNRDQKLKNSKTWVENNREKSNKYKNNWKINHREQHLKQAREYASNRRKDPHYRLSKNMSKAIWECLKNNKKQFSWLKFVNFSLNDLIVHLESKFTPEMTWENYGTYWHIDHVKPLSWFDLKTEFNDAWTLSNLQPLEATKNLSKNNRYIG
jgi:hypothetical protein